MSDDKSRVGQSVTVRFTSSEDVPHVYQMTVVSDEDGKLIAETPDGAVRAEFSAFGTQLTRLMR